MGTKHRDARQLELFDGETVEKYQMAFKGTAFYADEVDVEKLTYGDHVCLMVIASVGETTFKTNKEEEIVRINKLDVIRAVELDASIADYALAKQQASAGTPMLPNFADPDDEDMDEYRLDLSDDDDLDGDDDGDSGTVVASTSDEAITPLADDDSNDGPNDFDAADGIVLSGD